MNSTLWRAALKWPRLQRLEVLEVPVLEARAVQVPKAASGTIRMEVVRQLREATGLDLHKKDLWDYTRFVTPQQLGRMRPESFSFAFARNPYTRLVSCYRHKIARLREQGRRISPLFWVYGRTFSLDMGFPAFVEAVASVPDERAEKHFRSQNRFLFRDGKPLVDFIGRLESFDRDWAEICSHTKLKPVARAYNVTGGGRSQLGDWYNSRLLSLVNERYRDDFDLLGYPTVTEP